MKRIISIVLFGVIVTATILITACKWKESEGSDRRISDEAQARILLSDARNQLKSGDFSGARETQDRSLCPELQEGRHLAYGQH